MGAAAPAVAGAYAAAPAIAAHGYAAALQLLPSLLKFIPATPLHKYLKVTVIGLWLKCPAETDTIKTRGSTCPCWLLSMLSCRHHKCNVLVMSLQYDPNSSNIKTSGIVFVMLNVLIVRYRRELFIK